MWLRITLWAMLLGSLVMGYFGFQTGSATTTVVGMGLMVFLGFLIFFLVKMSFEAGLVFVKVVLVILLIGAFILLCVRGCQMLLDKGRQGAAALEERSRMITSTLHETSFLDKVKSYFDFSPNTPRMTIPPSNKTTVIQAQNQSAQSTIIKGNAEGVLSGSVFKMNGMFIKLYGISAPVPNQTCLDKRSANYNCGRVATQKLKKLLNGKLLSCTPVTWYTPSEIVATCSYNNYDIGASMVSVGWALADRRVTPAYVPYEKEARAQTAGLWAGKFMAPWEYEKPVSQGGAQKGFFEGLF